VVGVQWKNICSVNITVDAWGMCIAMVMPHLSELRKEATVRIIFIAIKLVTLVCWKVVAYQLSQNVFLICFVHSFLY
jgi:hypothetical protein